MLIHEDWFVRNVLEKTTDLVGSTLGWLQMLMDGRTDVKADVRTDGKQDPYTAPRKKTLLYAFLLVGSVLLNRI